MKSNVCFFLQTNDSDIINRNEFYKIDIEILKELGFNIKICNSYRQLPSDVTFYFIWWWTYAIFPVLLSKVLRKKSIITGTFDLEHPLPGMDYYSRPYYQRFLLKYSARLADMNIMVSKYEFERFRQQITADNVFYSPHVLDVEKYKVHNNKNREKKIFSLAWMNDLNARRKCIPEIIKAAAILKNSGHNILFHIGGNMEKDALYLKFLAEELDVKENVIFLGVVDESAKLKYLTSCGIYLQPTIFEGFGVAIAEALLCGAPVISSNVGAVPEVTGGNCVYVDGKKPEEIAGAVLQVFDNYEENLKRAETGSMFIKENYYFDRRKNDIMQVLKQLKIML